MSGQVGGLIGRKLGMTRVFDAEGTHVPVTVIAAGPCPVIQVAGGTGGAPAAGPQVQLGFRERKPQRTPQAVARHLKRGPAPRAPHLVKSFLLAGPGGGPE